MRQACGGPTHRPGRTGAGSSWPAPASPPPRLLCAGLTAFTPFQPWEAGRGQRIGVVGLGGLGHVALKPAVARGADVTVFPTSPGKVADAWRMAETQEVADYCAVRGIAPEVEVIRPDQINEAMDRKAGRGARHRIVIAMAADRLAAPCDGPASALALAKGRVRRCRAGSARCTGPWASSGRTALPGLLGATVVVVLRTTPTAAKPTP